MVDDLTQAQAAVTLRPATPADRDFLLAVYASTRADELSLTDWTEDQKAAFVTMQFEAQDRAYHATYPDARFLVISAGTMPVGRLYLARLTDEIRIVDIAIMPEHRGRGIASRLLAGVIAEAEAAGLPVRLHVEHWNRARRLYERLGFRTIAAGEIYEMMERPVVEAVEPSRPIN